MKRSALTMARVQLHVPGSTIPRDIGWLSQIGDNLRVSFDDDYVDDGSRPTLSQLYTGATDAESRAILRAVNDERLVQVGKLPSYFSNLLPEGENRKRLANQRGCDEDDELELLSAAGHDLSGGVEVVPANDPPPAVLELHATKGLEPVEAGTVAEPVGDGFSVDGVQTKFSGVSDGNRRYVLRRGVAAGEFIMKLPSAKHPDLVLNEGVCYRLADAVGIQTAGAEVRPIAELDVPSHVKDKFSEFLLVPRFDRLRRGDGSVQRVHFEELAQAVGLDTKRKYKDIPGAMRALLTILKASDAPQSDIDEVFRRWTAYALMGNCDAHTKNWGLVYPDGRAARLAPAYDVLCVTAYFDEAAAQDWAVNRKMDESMRKWDEDAAEALAKSAGLLSFNRARRIVRETAAKAAATWPALLADAPGRVATTITRRLAELAPARSAAAALAGGRPRP